ncbi:hypothetical protein ACFV0L_03105 [Streptosporangium canum]|uniref:hypothetical protein n=1 Tax=Streptosporangium canum TaxID=324952 RepID=UPI0036B82061
MRDTTSSTVSPAELLVLARALNVPPLRLALPIGEALQTEVLPGVTVGTWQAAQWFTGHEAFPTTAATVDGDDAWSDGSDFEERRKGMARDTSERGDKPRSQRLGLRRSASRCR